MLLFDSFKLVLILITYYTVLGLNFDQTILRAYYNPSVKILVIFIFNYIFFFKMVFECEKRVFLCIHIQFTNYFV